MAQFDLSKTQALYGLLALPADQRDEHWTIQFYHAVVDASLVARPTQIIRGPDGFGYFALYLPKSGESFDAFCVSHILGVCTDRGFGIVLDPDQAKPAWVFSYGNLWSLRVFGSFDGRLGEDKGPIVPAEKKSVLFGAPSEEFFPAWARDVVRGFMKSLGIADPRVFLLSDPSTRPAQSLVFSVLPSDFESEEKFKEAMAKLRWMVPPHVGLLSLAAGAEYGQHFRTF